MSTTTFLRGFKVPLPVLNAFLLANKIDESMMICFGIPPLYNKEDQVTTLLRKKLSNEDTKTRIIVPSRNGFEHATSAYIAYNWTVVLVQRRLGPEDFSDAPPPGFEDLRREILSYADGAESLADDARYQTAAYIIITDDQKYVPPELKPRLLVCKWEFETTPQRLNLFLFTQSPLPTIEPFLRALTRWACYRINVSSQRIYE